MDAFQSSLNQARGPASISNYPGRYKPRVTPYCRLRSNRGTSDKGSVLGRVLGAANLWRSWADNSAYSRLNQVRPLFPSLPSVNFFKTLLGAHSSKFCLD